MRKILEDTASARAVDEFLVYLLHELQLAGRTGYEYGLELYAWGSWLAQPGRDQTLETAQEVDLRAYVTELSLAKRRGVLALRRMLTALRSFYKWAERAKGWRNIVVSIQLGKLPKKLPRRLTEREIAAILSALTQKDRENFRDIRNRALVLFLYTSGLRRGELQALQVADLNLADRQCRVLGKGSKERIVFFPERTAQALAQWMRIRPAGSEGALFVTTKGVRLSSTQIADIVKAIGKRANFHKSIAPHMLRHTYGAMLVEKGTDLVTVRELLGHESLVTTEIYLKISDKHKRAAYDRANLLDDPPQE